MVADRAADLSKFLKEYSYICIFLGAVSVSKEVLDRMCKRHFTHVRAIFHKSQFHKTFFGIIDGPCSVNRVKPHGNMPIAAYITLKKFYAIGH